MVATIRRRIDGFSNAALSCPVNIGGSSCRTLSPYIIIIMQTRIVRFEFDFVCKRTVFFTFSSSVNLKETQEGAALTRSSAVSPLQRKKLNLN